MNSSSASIDRLRIATPCSAGWDEMTGNNRVRFCDQCQLNVYNIAELSRTEVENLISSSEGRICARLYRRVDGRVITKDCPVGLRALRLRVSKRVAAMFAAMVSLTSIVFGQEWSTKKTGSNSQTRITRTNATSPGRVVSGTVMDRNLAVIVDAKITLTNTATSETWTIKTSAEGNFEFKPQATGAYSISVEAIYFQKYEVKSLIVDEGNSINVDIILEVATQGELITMGVVASSELDATVTGSPIIINEQIIRRLPIQK